MVAERCSARCRVRLIVAGAALVALAAAGRPVAAAQIDWVLHGPDCTGASSTLVVPCGNYGVFRLVDVDPAGCASIASGTEEPAPYGLPAATAPFRIRARMLDDVVAAIPQVYGSASPAATTWGGTTAGGGVPHAAWGASPVSPSSGAGTGPKWIAVLDFAGAHGDSTTWLVDSLSGPAVPAALLALDGPGLEALGPKVGDFHVLARLCEIAEAVDVQGVPAPLAANMSFGRKAHATDARSPADCQAGSAACQVARVIEHLSQAGTTFAAAAGNHQEPLFPGLLSNVVSVGLLDLNIFLHHGAAKPAWETPGASAAWFPGSSLCLGTWAAPAGSSYSSAAFVGWIADALSAGEGLASLGDGPWAPQWNPGLGCHVPSAGSHGAVCNEEVEALFEGLAGASEATCWSIASSPVAALPVPGASYAPPALPSQDGVSEATHPTPESDPCVPCVGSFVGTGGAAGLEIDLSQSAPVAAGVALDSVFLRVETTFHPLTLTPTQLQEIEAGQLASIVIGGAGSLVSPGNSLSLYYQLNKEPATACPESPGCYWSSTPILLKASSP